MDATLIETLQAVWNGSNVDAQALVLRELARQQLSVDATVPSSDYPATAETVALAQLMAGDCASY